MYQITGYGNFLWSNTKPTSAKRHKLYKKFNFRSIISPQYYRKRLKKSLVLHGYALDNGAYLYHKKNTIFDGDLFLDMVKEIGAGADFIVIPDCVQNSKITLNISWPWIHKLRRLGFGNKLLFVYQDGMKKHDLEIYTSQNIGIFIGGSTQAKLDAIPWIGDLCRKNGVWCHVGRVNTKKRIELCIENGIDSFDGSGFSMFPNTFTRIEDVEKKLYLFQQHKRTFLLKSLQERCNSTGITESDIHKYWMEIQNTETSGVGLPKKYTHKEKKLLEI